MKITDIRPRRKGLSAVYIDGEYALSLDTQTLLEHRIDIGRELDDEELSTLSRAATSGVQRKRLCGLSHTAAIPKRSCATKSDAPATDNPQRRRLSAWRSSVL